MPAASRADLDIAELRRSGISKAVCVARLLELPGQPVEDDDQPSEPMVNGEPKRRTEFFVAASAILLIGLSFVPPQLKKGEAWYVTIQALVLFAVVVSTVGLFWGNVHIKMLKFLSVKKIFVKVVLLSLIDWIRVILLPDPGWEVVDRISSTTGLVLRLTFICLDASKGLSRWFRLFFAFFFMFGNFTSILQSYFLNPAQVLYVVSATQTTITTSAIQASIGTTMVTLTAAMGVTIWQDKNFQYSALYRSFLPKLSVETMGVEPGSAEMDTVLEESNTALVAWRGWPKAAAVTILISAVTYVSTIIMSCFQGLLPLSIKIALGGIILALGVAGAYCFFAGNISWVRWKYAFSSTQGIVWTFYTLVFMVVGLSEMTPASWLSTLYTTIGLLCWFSFEAVRHISRVMHITITVIVAFTLAVGIYLTAYVWQDDVEVADLNGDDVQGTVTRYDLVRICFCNLLLLMAGSLRTVVKKNLSNNSYFVLVSGNVLRRDILEVEPGADLDGQHDLIGSNSLKQRLSRHSKMSLINPPAHH